jgi:hypothetical protein
VLQPRRAAAPQAVLACLALPAAAVQPLQRLLLLPQQGPCPPGMVQCGATTQPLNL